jgi:hypothetical protein
MKIPKVIVPRGAYISAFFFVVALCLDFYVTNKFSYGDPSSEANMIGRIWWEIVGSWRYIEIPIWIGVVFTSAYIIMMKSRLLSLAWVNMLTVSHFLGFATWIIPNKYLGFMYSLFTNEFALGYLFTLVGVLVGLPIALLQIKIDKNLV